MLQERQVVLHSIDFQLCMLIQEAYVGFPSLFTYPCVVNKYRDEREAETIKYFCYQLEKYSQRKNVSKQSKNVNCVNHLSHTLWTATRKASSWLQYRHFIFLQKQS